MPHICSCTLKLHLLALCPDLSIALPTACIKEDVFFASRIPRHEYLFRQANLNRKERAWLVGEYPEIFPEWLVDSVKE